MPYNGRFGLAINLNDRATSDAHVLQAHLGGDRNFCYLVGERASGEVAAVEPAYAPDRLGELARERGLRITRVLITHGHPDHVGGAIGFARRIGTSVHAGRADRVGGAEPLDDGGRLPLGGGEVSALLRPGYTPGHVYLYRGQLFTGDLLFCGKVVGTGAHFGGRHCFALSKSKPRDRDHAASCVVPISRAVRAQAVVLRWRRFAHGAGTARVAVARVDELAVSACLPERTEPPPPS